ncbi:peptidase [Pseudoalteromonas gelatinilytica]
MVDLPVDINNSMKVGEAAHVKLTGLLDGVGEVALADVQFQYAYGQECTISNVPAYIYCPVSTKFSSENWIDAQVEHIDGEWVATIPNTGNVGDFVHIRTIVSDYGSSQAEQITMRAYMLD